MQETYNQLQNPTNFLNLACSYHYLGGCSLPFMLPSTFNAKHNQQHISVFSNKVLTQSSFNGQYRSRAKENIILTSTDHKKVQKLKTPKISDSEEQTTKLPKKCVQKESRNINSNLLRIFLKNLIEIRIYTEKIKRIAQQIKGQFTLEQFYQWIEGFAINFKNYIRASEIAKLLTQQQPLHFRKTFYILLHHYCREIGLTHCLTSKRIERKTIKMHLQGLRYLSHNLLNVSYVKK